MTKKRFENVGKDIFQYGEWWCSANGEHCADVIATAINELIEETEQLKQEYQKLKHRHSLLHDVCLDAECERDSLKKDVNSLEKENEQLKKEKEFWKSDACSLSSLNSILSNELSIAQEQGYEPSKPYKEYIASIKTEYDKFWENKIKTHNNQLNGVRE